MFPFIINSGSFEKAARRRQLSPSNLSNIFRIYCKLQRRHDGRGWARAHTDKCGAELRHPDTGVTSQPCPPDFCSPDSCPTVSCPPDSCPPHPAPSLSPLATAGRLIRDTAAGQEMAASIIIMASVNASDVALMSSILPRRISVLHLAAARPHYCTLSPISCTRYSHLLLQPPAPAPAHLNPTPDMRQRRHVRVCLSLVNTRQIQCRDAVNARNVTEQMHRLLTAAKLISIISQGNF